MRAVVHTTFVLFSCGSVGCTEKLGGVIGPAHELPSVASSRSDAGVRHSSAAATASALVLRQRIPAPPGFTRVAVAGGSFGEYLRELALRPSGSPVLDYRGRTVLEHTDPRLVAVAALDLSPVDLQQCADSIIRLHAEWRWQSGDRTMTYYAASGDAMPYASWAGGLRIREERGHIVWRAGAAPSDTYPSFRSYLDRVFTYANTGSISRFGQKVKKADIAAGDYFVLPGSPGHTVLVLDVAARTSGELALLLGQGFMPAQHFHVIADSSGSAWYRPDADDVAIRIPFGYEFRWDQLRRFAE